MDVTIYTAWRNRSTRRTRFRVMCICVFQPDDEVKILFHGGIINKTTSQLDKNSSSSPNAVHLHQSLQREPYNRDSITGAYNANNKTPTHPPSSLPPPSPGCRRPSPNRSSPPTASPTRACPPDRPEPPTSSRATSCAAPCPPQSAAPRAASPPCACLLGARARG